jgi:hypothetical protein
VSENPVNHVIETYINPHANPELKSNWGKKETKVNLSSTKASFSIAGRVIQIQK